MLKLPLFLALTLFVSGPSLATENWRPYPDHLASFDYSQDTLGQHWQNLTGGFRGPLPTAETLKADAQKWPELYELTRKHLRSISTTHPELAFLAEGEPSDHFEDYAALLRRTWSLLFNGSFQEARELGLALGPAGYFPALYAQALQATLVEADEDTRRTLLEEVIARTRKIMPVAPDHPMIRFGNAYGKARILEQLSASEAIATGYTSEVKDTLTELLNEDPDNIYALTLYAGVQAGIIEKAGSLIARLTYGAQESAMETLFDKALNLAPQYPAVYHEYARARLKVDDEDGKQSALALLEKTQGMRPSSAEEALILRAVQQLRQDLKN
ncbi:hypothetical protein [Marinobacter sediminum]|uniref:hypothetical protein n=1 Tax=Marinobacter sediminum TaxID=256323 RepID=UPI0019394825|nr:hypothetical protein [Marinobacter sediminum]